MEIKPTSLQQEEPRVVQKAAPVREETLVAQQPTPVDKKPAAPVEKKVKEPVAKAQPSPPEQEGPPAVVDEQA